MNKKNKTKAKILPIVFLRPEGLEKKAKTELIALIDAGTETLNSQSCDLAKAKNELARLKEQLKELKPKKAAKVVTPATEPI